MNEVQMPSFIERLTGRITAITVWLGTIRYTLCILTLLHITLLASASGPIMVYLMTFILFATLPEWLAAQDWFRKWSKTTRVLTLSFLYGGLTFAVMIGLNQALALSPILGLNPLLLMCGLILFSVYMIYHYVKVSDAPTAIQPEIMSYHRLISEIVGLVLTAFFVSYYFVGITPIMAIITPLALIFLAVGLGVIMAWTAWAKYTSYVKDQAGIARLAHLMEKTFKFRIPPVKQLMTLMVGAALSMFLLILPGMGLLGWSWVTALIASIICIACVVNVWRSTESNSKIDVASIIKLSALPVVATFTAAYTLFMVQPLLLASGLGVLPTVVIMVVLGLGMLYWVRSSFHIMKEDISQTLNGSNHQVTSGDRTPESPRSIESQTLNGSTHEVKPGDIKPESGQSMAIKQGDHSIDSKGDDTSKASDNQTRSMKGSRD